MRGETIKYKFSDFNKEHTSSLKMI